jgi:hypothetical protein
MLVSRTDWLQVRAGPVRRDGGSPSRSLEKGSRHLQDDVFVGHLYDPRAKEGAFALARDGIRLDKARNRPLGGLNGDDCFT